MIRYHLLALVLLGFSHSATLASPQPALPEVTFSKLTDNVWLHTSFQIFPQWGAFPSNGLIIVTNEDVILIDTAWTNEQTQQILNWVGDTLQRKVTIAVLTHAHNDKMGGVEILKSNGVKTYAHYLSNQIAPTKGLVPAEYNLFADKNYDTTFKPMQIFYPGPGHTKDNIVVYLEEDRLLFGGCLIRPGGAKTLGNTADASLNTWGATVRNVMRQFPEAETIIPSHGPPAGTELLLETIELTLP